MGINSYSKNTYPNQLFKIFSKMKIGESIDRDELIQSIWNKTPDWFLRRSFDAARSNAIKGTNIKLQSRKGIITKLN